MSKILIDTFPGIDSFPSNSIEFYCQDEFTQNVDTASKHGILDTSAQNLSTTKLRKPLIVNDNVIVVGNASDVFQLSQIKFFEYEQFSSKLRPSIVLSDHNYICKIIEQEIIVDDSSLTEKNKNIIEEIQSDFKDSEIFSNSISYDSGEWSESDKVNGYFSVP